MKYMPYLQQRQKRIASFPTSPWLLLMLLASMTTGGLLQQVWAAQSPLPQLSSLWKQLPQNPRPFMHLPYYGSEKLQTRVNSYFDHDEPWYASDGLFVRYDGKRWTGSDVSVLNCNPGASCYDGHNGYDLHMRFEPVLSSAAGNVIRAGWYNALNHSDGFGLWAAIDHGNGFNTVYGHLSALTVAVGEHVGTQWQIGTSGTTGSSTGPHLHFGTYFYPSWQATDPSGWRGNYTDPNIVPDDALWTQGTNDTPVPLLGGQGKVVAPGAILVDDDSPGWSHTGQWNRAKAATDIDGALHWTGTTSGAATATATWQSPLLTDGYYEVGAFVDNNHASSSWASYTVYSADPNHHNLIVKNQIEVDQEHVGVFQNSFGSVNTGVQWIGLGTYYFTSAQACRVVLNNATGENNLQLAADAIEFAPLAPVAYGFVLTSDNTPARMAAGSRVNISLAVQNTGSFPWQAEGQNEVQLVYRWLDSQGHTLSTSQPVALTHDLVPKAAEPVSVDVPAPAQAGTYTLQWDLVQGSRVFSRLGAQPKNDSVTVADSNSTSADKYTRRIHKISVLSR